MSAEPWNGPWADDVRRIFDIVQGHLNQADNQAGNQAGSAEEHSPECRYCPICQGMAFVRRSGPDTLDRIAELAAGLAATLRATDPEGGDHMGDADPPAPPTAAPPATVRIDVTE